MEYRAIKPGIERQTLYVLLHIGKLKMFVLKRKYAYNTGKGSLLLRVLLASPLIGQTCLGLGVQRGHWSPRERFFHAG